MGTQRPVMIGEEPTKDLGQPIAEHHGKKREKVKGKKERVGAKIKAEKFEKEKTVEKAKTEESKEEKKAKISEAKPVVAKGKGRVGKAKVRSKKYQQALALIDRKKIYDLSTALDLAQKTSFSRFDGNIEVYLRLLSKTGKPENVQGTLKYPHDIGRKIKELEEGLTEYKTDSYGIIHQIIGKVSNDRKALEENFRALITVLPREKITSVYLCPTMGPSIKVLTK